MVVRGEDGADAQAFDMDQEMHGVVQRFVAAARNVLSEIPGGKLAKKLPQGVVRFTKNGDQESLEVVLQPPPPVDNPEPRPRKPESPPDYCVVDVVIPSSTGVRASFAAVGITPEDYAGAPFVDEEEFDFQDFSGEPWYSQGKEDGEALMQYSRHALQDLYVPISDRVASLRLDLRRMPPGESVQVDVWGYVRPAVAGYVPVDSRIGIGLRSFEDGTYSWPDGSGSPHDGTLRDPLGNVSVRFVSGVVPSFPRNFAFSNLALASIISSYLQADLWDETRFEPAYIEPGSFFPIPSPVYIQRRLDPDSGAELAERVLRITVDATFEVVGDTERSTWRFQTDEKVRNGPPAGVSVARPVDVTMAFYWAEVVAVYTDDNDGSGIWTTGDGVVPERVQIGEGVIWNAEQPGSVEFTEDSGPLTRIGTITVQRESQSASFEAA